MEVIVDVTTSGVKLAVTEGVVTVEVIVMVVVTVGVGVTRVSGARDRAINPIQ